MAVLPTDHIITIKFEIDDTELTKEIRAMRIAKMLSECIQHITDAKNSVSRLIGIK